MIIAIGLFFSVFLLLLLGYIGELISSGVSKASSIEEEEMELEIATSHVGK